MVPIRVADIAARVGARLLVGDPLAVVSSISTDSRVLNRGDFYIALRGPNFDGNDFIDASLMAGACGFMTDRRDAGVKTSASPAPQVVLQVEDTQKALGQIAGLIRENLGAQVVGITGSTGKTSTKDILAAIAKRDFTTLASSRNYNNEIGLPLTIAKAKPETEILILEMGMRGLGQIASLAEIAKPVIGIITNVGLTHVGILGAQNKIAKAKSELVAALPPDGYAVLNYDDQWTEYLRTRTRAKIVTFGFGAGADFSAREIAFDDLAGASWQIVENGQPGRRVSLSIPGRHNIVNALAAVAAARLLGVSQASIVDGLADANLTNLRLSIVETPGGLTVINDTYNANPASMMGALETLMKVRAKSKHIAILGLMSELGDLTSSAHVQIGKHVADLRVDYLATVGEIAGEIGAAAIGNGMKAANVARLASISQAADWLAVTAGRGDAVLVKGSRVAGLEALVEQLVREQ